jgi:hypothetical protein
MDEKRFSQNAILRDIEKQHATGVKILELMKKHHTGILLHNQFIYKKPDKRITEKMIQKIPFEDYESISEKSRTPLNRLIIQAPTEFLNSKDAALLRLGYLMVLRTVEFTTQKPPITKEQYLEFVGGSTSDYIKQMYIAGSFLDLGEKILTLMKKTYPKQYGDYQGSGLFDIADMERYIKKRAKQAGVPFNLAKKQFFNNVKRNIPSYLTPKQFFMWRLAAIAKDILFQQRERFLQPAKV